jgi:hypothetical protein
VSNPDDVRRALELLELDENASSESITVRRREMAIRNHPDRGGTHEAMAAVNRAADLLLWWRRRGGVVPGVADTDTDTERNPVRRSRRGAERMGEPRADRPSFVMEALPVVAHEALLLAAGVLGQVCDDDPPYVIETLIAVDESIPELSTIDGGEIWCRLELVPDAGSTTVTIIADVDPESLVRLWCDTVNELGLPD